MRWARTLTVVGAHAEGEIGRVVTGGVIAVPGRTMAGKMRHLNRADDGLRRFLLAEPRGFAQMSVNLLLPPARPEADAGFIVIQPDGAHAMSGSNAMCVATVLLETGIVAMKEPETTVVLDTPAGLVTAHARCRDGKCERVALEFPPSFAVHLEHPLEVEGLGRIIVDVAFGGAFYVLVDADALQLPLRAEAARRLVEVAAGIKRAARGQIEVAHPTISDLRQIEYVMFCAHEGKLLRNATVIFPGRLDRSPCGTGTAARLAVLHGRGRVAAGEELTFASIIGSRFEAVIAGTTDVAGRPAILPRISGRAWLYSIEHLGLDPTDPYPTGFTLPDTWGPGAGASG